MFNDTLQGVRVGIRMGIRMGVFLGCDGIVDTHNVALQVLLELADITHFDLPRF